MTQVEGRDRLSDEVPPLLLSELGAAMEAHALLSITDAAGRITYVNDRFCALCGYSRAELIGQDYRLLNSGLHDKAFIDELWIAISHGRVWRGDLRNRARDGSLHWLETTIVPFADARGVPRQYVAIHLDITARQQHEGEIERLRRLYAALSQVNQAIVWSHTQQQLFDKVCRVLVEDGGFLMAWIGWHDPATHRLAPVATWGDESGFVSGIRIYTDDRPEGRGPTGSAFRSERPYICNDMLGDPATLPWRPEIVRRGLRSSAALPIRVGGRVVGTLTVYADAPDFFREQEVSLLTEAATDISYALDNFGREAERGKAEAALQQEQLFSDTMIESMPGVVYVYDEGGRFLRWNRNFESVSGYSAQEIAGMHPLDFYEGEEKALLAERIAEVFTQGEASVEARFVARDGRATPYLFTGRRVIFNGATCLVGMGIDISARKQAEASGMQLAAIVDSSDDAIISQTPLGIITSWNRGAEAMFGHAAAEAIGQPMLMLFPPELRQQEAQVRARIAGGENVQHFDTVRVRHDGRRIDVSVTNSPVRDAQGRIVGASMIARDITAQKQAQQALRETEQRLAAVVENLREGLVIHDPDGDFLHWNPAALRMLGFGHVEDGQRRKHEFATLFELANLDGDVIEPHQRPLARVQRGETIDGYEIRLRRTDMAWERILRYSGCQVRYADGKLLSFLMLSDVTAQKLAAEQLRHSRINLANAQRIARLGSWELDIPRQQLLWSEQMFEILGIDPSALSASFDTFMARVHPEDRARMDAAQRAAVSGQAELDIEHRVVLPDGSEKFVHSHGELVRDADGKPWRLTGTVQDITQRKQSEAALRELNESLEHKVAERTTALNAALVRAEAADRIKSAFLATMSHELRTPLNSIIGFTGIVLQGLAGPLNAEQSKQLGMVRGSARHLLELINDVLDISKIEANQLEVRSEIFDLPALIERVVASVRPLALSKDIGLALVLPPGAGEMLGDRRRVEQILLNLLNNAIKFTERGTVTVSAEWASSVRILPGTQPRPAVRLRVADTGIGIKKTDLPTLFQPFRQIDTGLTRLHEGTGLGLAICRRLAQLMGGEISATSNPGKGSEFVVTLPLQKAS